MAIHTINESDRVLREKLLSNDPFIHSAPCWKIRVWHLLPPETINTRPTRFQLEKKDKELIMSIRTIESSQAPQRLRTRGGGISSKQDYSDLLAALNTVQKNQALIVDMTPGTWEGIKKPESTFALNLRLRFQRSGLPITAYMSGPMQVTVRRLTDLEQKELASGKGKRGPRKSK